MAPIKCRMDWDCSTCIKYGCKFMQLAITEHCVKDVGILKGEGYLVDDASVECPEPLPSLNDDDDVVEGIHLGLAILFFFISLGGAAMMRKKVVDVLRILNDLLMKVKHGIRVLGRVLARIEGSEMESGSLDEEASVCNGHSRGVRGHRRIRPQFRPVSISKKKVSDKPGRFSQMIDSIVKRFQQSSATPNLINFSDPTINTEFVNEISDHSTPKRGKGNLRKSRCPSPILSLSERLFQSHRQIPGPSRFCINPDTRHVSSENVTENSPAILNISQPGQIQKNCNSAPSAPLLKSGKQNPFVTQPVEIEMLPVTSSTDTNTIAHRIPDIEMQSAPSSSTTTVTTQNPFIPLARVKVPMKTGNPPKRGRPARVNGNPPKKQDDEWEDVDNIPRKSSRIMERKKKENKK